MRLKYLGTSAYEGIPAIFCECETCMKSKSAGGKNIRTRSQAVIDENLLLDFPADTYMHVLYNDLDFSKIRHCIITHNHSDHLYPEDLFTLREGFSHPKSDSPLNIYGSDIVIGSIREKMPDTDKPETLRISLKEITMFREFEIGGYRITPYKANHSEYTGPLFFAVKKDKKTLLYANDTGYFPAETWDYIEKTKPYFNFVSLDCTCGTMDCRDHHMGIKTNLEVKERLEDMGCAGKDTVF